MRTVLLTRRSSFQNYAANYLHRRGQLDHAVIETGVPFPGMRDLVSRRDWKALLLRIKTEVWSTPSNLRWKFLYMLRKRQIFGHADEFDRRVLGDDYAALHPDLARIEVGDINDPRVVDLIRRLRPGLIYVFGTRLIRPEVFATFDCPVVNMHWGWSPRFRGEGIVSALAEAGPEALRVTVHLLSAEPDGGDILFRDRPTVDATDNFYSIGLKLTKLGVERFSQCFDVVARKGHLTGTKQDLGEGRVYSTKFFRNHPEYYSMAWRRLKNLK